jgi:hypothetical protein
MLTHVLLACLHYLTHFAHLLDLQLTYTLASTNLTRFRPSCLAWIHFDGLTINQCPQSIMLGFAPNLKHAISI